MNKQVTGIEVTVQDKMHVSVHQNERQNQNVVFVYDWKYPVHTVEKLVGIMKQNIHRIPISVEMPTVIYRNTLTFNDSQVETNIGRNNRFHFININHITNLTPLMEFVVKIFKILESLIIYYN